MTNVQVFEISHLEKTGNGRGSFSDEERKHFLEVKEAALYKSHFSTNIHEYRWKRVRKM